MRIFDLMAEKGHEQIVFCREDSVGLRAIISIHDTTLGPALGGCRMWNYKSEDEALTDVLRLSRGMTYKAAIAGLNLGGGKAVIIGDPKTEKREELFRAFGIFVESLNGRYITAEDVGTSVGDMEWVRQETKHVTGLSRSLGGGGDPSPLTAIGVHSGMRACAQEVFGNDSLHGLKIAVQGLGHVGYSLIGHLAREGAQLVVADIDEQKVDRVVKEYSVETADVDNIHATEADIFAPCALGSVINDQTIDRLRCKIVAGAANNQLEDINKHGKALFEKGIVYAPDYVINAGGLINVANELQGYNREKALVEVKNIYNIVAMILNLSKKEKIPTVVASNRLAERRIEQIARIKKTWVPATTR
ncbi:MAG: leucine dehydrogenase [Deltaproteobacteria bacterium RIFCSPHIGHO2_12_FULL_43_9]|nr:MAG: leucine dehydrogenase [Deltaproteobacteria bacterium RIFCSPHIGHO2_12_FULL_43_9]